MPSGIISDHEVATAVRQQPHSTLPREAVLDFPSVGRLSLFVKRAVDLAGGLFALLLFLPVILFLCLLIKATSPGPIFYPSLRTGRNGREFHMYKFRTMTPNADRMWKTLAQEHGINGQLFKLPNDQRITPVGGFLRKYSLDELPQLLNVLKGEMSLVGPRPFVPDESRLFKPPYTARFNVTPGMTGPWQVGGRSNLSFHELCCLELDYIRNWTLWQDFKILFKTVPSVLMRRGAY